VAKSRSFKSKKELEKEGRTLGIELDRRHSKEDLIEELEAVKPRFATDAEAGFKEESSDVTWNSIEEFTEAVTSTGMLFNQEFIPVNIPALYKAYTSNPEEFKETSAYKFLTS
jgi:hypothetical protein